MEGEQAANLIECAREAIASDPRVLTAYLFGSFARGTASDDSDLDIAILFQEPIEPALVDVDKLRDGSTA